MDKNKIIDLLKGHNIEDVQKFAAYCVRLKNEKNRDQQFKNPWMTQKNEEQLAQLFKRVAKDGLVFDGVHVTLQSTGVSYDYVAYKNKMFLAYPETELDINLVYKDDTFSFKKESGKVQYQHLFGDPFNRDDDKISGGYVVIKNKRGEFLTLLSKNDFDKHRRIAKTDFIWKNWYPEMCLKTIMKKSSKYHFDDIFQGIEELDNENYDIEKDVSKSKVEELKYQIAEALEIYQGDDKETIRDLCQKKVQAIEFTEDFAKNILEQLSPATV